MIRLLSFYHPKLPVYLVYMLQQVEYEPNDLLRWLLRLPRLTHVMYRKTLILTGKAKLLVGIAYAIWLIVLGICVIVGLINIAGGIILLLMLPFLTILLFYLMVMVAWVGIEKPRRKNEIRQARAIFSRHSGIKLAILGSYGKTTMKELLLALLGTEKKIAATPGNKNVAISHARWSRKLTGDEDILLIEYGEGAPGDIAYFAHLSKPNIAIITGLAPNHLDRYKTLDAVADDLLAIAQFVPPQQLFINIEDVGLANRAVTGANGYDSHSVLGWKISSIRIGYEGTSFVMSKGNKKLALHSLLLGRHQVGPLALSAALSEQFGISHSAIDKAVAAFEPYEHRMKPRQQNGAWIIEDTYNGNLEGVRAGLELMKELPAKRKIYITPGLVDQGEETERVHYEIGRLIAMADPDLVVLMKNSVTGFINESLEKANFKGKLQIETKPLEFYTNLTHFVAAGDLVLMQNDWTDNYA